MSWRSFIVALVLPVWVTGATLASASRNRSGGREAIVLSEREVFVSRRTDDNTTATLTLSWQPPSMRRDTWFNAEKLVQLGFDTRMTGSDLRDRRQLPRHVFVVLELDGPAWLAFLQERRADVAAPRAERTIVDELADKGSRLVVVDAGLDAAVLASRYADARRYLIAAGTARAQLVSMLNESPYVVGTIDRIVPQRIHVPREWAAQLPSYDVRNGRLDVRFDVDVRYGRNYEPWVTAVRRGRL